MAKNNENAQSGINIIGTGTSIIGELKSMGDVRIDGSIKGSVSSKAKVVIGQTGVIEGDVVCRDADFSGNINGKVEVAELLFLKATAKVNGDIITGKLVVEAGAIFTGNCNMGSQIKELRGSEAKQQQRVAAMV